MPPYLLSQGSTHQHLVVAVGCGFHGNLLEGAWICETHSDRLCIAGDFWHESGPKHGPNRFPNFRLQCLVYMPGAVYCCSLQPHPFLSRSLQSFRVQVFPPVLPYREPVMCHHSACQEQEGNRNVPWMCQKTNTLTNVNVYHPHKITCNNRIYWHLINRHVWLNYGFRRPWLLYRFSQNLYRTIICIQRHRNKLETS